MNINCKNVLLIGYDTYSIKNGIKYFKGGTEVVTDALLRYLKSRNCEIIYSMTHGRLTKDLKSAYESDYNCTAYKLLPINDIINLRSNGYIDLIITSICTDATSKYYMEAVATNVNVPILIYNHGSNCHNIRDYGDAVINKSNVRLISATDHEYNEHLKFGFSADRLFKIDNPITVNQNISESDNGRFIINARMVEQKGIPNALELMKSINASVDLVGRDNNYKVYDKVMSYKNDMDMNYLGLLDRDELVEEIRNHKMLVLLPNGPEGKSLVMLESMALGTPVITWDDYSFNTFVNPEYNILLPRTDDYIEIFRDKYLPILDRYLDYDKRLEMSNEVISKYGLDSYYSRLDDIINNV